MVTPGDHVLVALSGGADSVALLGALVALAPEFGIGVCAAHLNHGLRGEESLRDQRCAVEVARRLGVPCVVGSSPVLEPGPNLEARARRERYAFLAAAAAQRRCRKIATGHTRDDQAETVLMRLLRGSGADGLTAIHAVRDGGIIRPLLESARAAVLEYVRAQGLPFCEDSSNRDRRFLRNRIRHEILPVLQALNPAAVRNLAAAAQGVTDELTWLRAQDERHLVAAVAADGALAVAAVRGADAAVRTRLVRAWLRRLHGDLAGLHRAHFEAVVDLACGQRPNGRVRLPRGEWVVREYEQMRCIAAATASVPPAPELEQALVVGATVCLRSGWRIRADLEAVADGWQRPTSLFEAVADARAVAVPLVVRTVRPGDRIQPLGLRGHRKLQDVLVDRKIPLAVRRTCPVVALEGEVLWVPGVIRSSRALVTANTRAAVRLVAEATAVAGT
ncbi:MAG: tRNA(Ile)-lysidine synthetase [Deltaproteobacteria bacterium]|nr:tRNA(Ile)-lysidine synthetase [Deltaproteobacteria bacterium]